MKSDQLEIGGRYIDTDGDIVVMKDLCYKMVSEKKGSFRYLCNDDLENFEPYEDPAVKIARLEAMLLEKDDKITELEKRDFASTVTEEIKFSIYDTPKEQEADIPETADGKFTRKRKPTGNDKETTILTKSRRRDMRNDYLANRLKPNIEHALKYDVSKGTVSNILKEIPSYVPERYRDIDGYDYRLTHKMSYRKFLFLQEPKK